MTHPHFPYPVRIKDDEAELHLVVDASVCPYPVRFAEGTTFTVAEVERPDPSVGIFGETTFTLESPDGLVFLYDGDDFFDDYDVDEDGRPLCYPGKFENVPVDCPGSEIPLVEEDGPDQGCAVCGEYRIAWRVGEDSKVYFAAHTADPDVIAAFRRRAVIRSKRCAICGEPCLPGRRYCSTRCHSEDEPGAYVDA